jgi:hypothetical protein
VAVIVVFVFMTIQSQLARVVLSVLTSNNALFVAVANNTAEKYVCPFDGDVYLVN